MTVDNEVFWMKVQSNLCFNIWNSLRYKPNADGGARYIRERYNACNLAGEFKDNMNDDLFILMSKLLDQ